MKTKTKNTKKNLVCHMHGELVFVKILGTFWLSPHHQQIVKENHKTFGVSSRNYRKRFCLVKLTEVPLSVSG